MGSFRSRLRDGGPSVGSFDPVPEAQTVISGWRTVNNRQPPHRSLGRRPSAAHAVGPTTRTSAKPARRSERPDRQTGVVAGLRLIAEMLQSSCCWARTRSRTVPDGTGRVGGRPAGARSIVSGRSARHAPRHATPGTAAAAPQCPASADHASRRRAVITPVFIPTRFRPPKNRTCSIAIARWQPSTSPKRTGCGGACQTCRTQSPDRRSKNHNSFQTGRCRGSDWSISSAAAG